MWINRLADAFYQSDRHNQYRSVLKVKTNSTSANARGKALLVGKEVVDDAYRSLVLTAADAHLRANGRRGIGDRFAVVALLFLRWQ